MRKLLSFGIALVIGVCAAQTVFALGVANSTNTARVTLQGLPFAWDISIRDVASPATSTTTIRWDANSMGIAWKASTQYIVLNATITTSGYKIKLYTRNKESGSAYKYVGASTVSLGGLVSVSSPTALPIPMAWRMVDASTTTAFSTLAAITTNPEATTGDGAYASSYIIDKGQPNFGTAPNPDYCTILNINGMKYGPGTADRGGSGIGRFYLFFSANFAAQSANVAGEYGTDTLTFQGFTE
ncbi:MAG: hypothetical protein LBQ47_06040 [Endomicrobium sp.]|nr:hypothetical protein [Endomicrobium sp.]